MQQVRSPRNRRPRGQPAGLPDTSTLAYVRTWRCGWTARTSPKRSRDQLAARHGGGKWHAGRRRRSAHRRRTSATGGTGEIDLLKLGASSWARCAQARVPRTGSRRRRHHPVQPVRRLSRGHAPAISCCATAGAGSVRAGWLSTATAPDAGDGARGRRGRPSRSPASIPVYARGLGHRARARRGVRRRHRARPRALGRRPVHARVAAARVRATARSRARRVRRCWSPQRHARVRHFALPALEPNLAWSAWAQPASLAVDSQGRVLAHRRRGQAPAAACERIGTPDGVRSRRRSAAAATARRCFVAVVEMMVLVADGGANQVFVFDATARRSAASRSRRAGCRVRWPRRRPRVRRRCGDRSHPRLRRGGRRIGSIRAIAVR